MRGSNAPWPGRDDHGAREVRAAAVGGDRPQLLAVGLDALERLDGLSQQRLRAVLQPLLDHAVDVLLAVDLREARDVEDVLLGIDGRDLAAELLEALDDAAARLAVAGVVGGGEARGPGADDRDVDHGVLTHRGQARGSGARSRRNRRGAPDRHDARREHRGERALHVPEPLIIAIIGAARGLDRRELRGPPGRADAAPVPRPRHAPGRGWARRHQVRRRDAGARRRHRRADDHPARGRPAGGAGGGAAGAGPGGAAGDGRRARNRGGGGGLGAPFIGLNWTLVVPAGRGGVLDRCGGGLRRAARIARAQKAGGHPRGGERPQRPVRRAARDRASSSGARKQLQHRRRAAAARRARRASARPAGCCRDVRRVVAAAPAVCPRPASRP